MLSLTINITWRTIIGALLIAVAVATSSLAIGRADRYGPDKKVYTCSSGTACVTGSSSGYGTWGVYAKAASADALHAETSTKKGNSAVTGISEATTGTGHGVFGSSHTGYGVFGVSSQGYYSYGGAGVYGESRGYTGAGVAGNGGNAGIGIFGTAHNSGLEQGVAGEFDGNGFLLQGYGPSGYFYVPADGSAYFSSTVSASKFITHVRSRTGDSLEAMVAMTPQAVMEDTGTAELLNGEAAVRFDQAFASAIDVSRGYQVFLTPNGNTRGLYVAAKYAGGFIVREIERGRSSIYFDYRVVARPYGASNARLPQLNMTQPMRRPKFPLPPNEPRQ